MCSRHCVDMRPWTNSQQKQEWQMGFDTTILASFAGVTATLLETQLWPMNAWGNSFSDSRVLRDAESM